MVTFLFCLINAIVSPRRMVLAISEARTAPYNEGPVTGSAWNQAFDHGKYLLHSASVSIPLLLHGEVKAGIEPHRIYF